MPTLAPHFVLFSLFIEAPFFLFVSTASSLLLSVYLVHEAAHRRRTDDRSLPFSVCAIENSPTQHCP